MSVTRDRSSKTQLSAEIARLVGMEDPGLSTGSTERKALFLGAARLIGSEARRKQSKPELARSIVESAGFVWRSRYESRGSTVTREGMLAVRDALRFLLGS